MWGFLYKINMEITLSDTLCNIMLNLEHPHETKKKKLNDPTTNECKLLYMKTENWLVTRQTGC